MLPLRLEQGREKVLHVVSRLDIAGTPQVHVAGAPEVIGLVEAEDALLGHADFLMPDIVGLVVGAKHRNVELLGGHAEYLRG